MISCTSVQPAVVVPIYRSSLHPYEWSSLHRLVSVLGCHDLIVLAPASLQSSIADALRIKKILKYFRWQLVEDHWLDSVASYNQLMLTRQFYAHYASQGITHILIYQLDAYVFRDELLHWCSQGLSYIGAPIYPSGASYGESNAQAIGVGGFSLRCAADFFRLLTASPRVLHLSDIPGIVAPFNWKGASRLLLRYAACRVLGQDHFSAERNRLAFWVGLNEDVLFGRYAPQLDPAFRVADYATARRFSIDRYVNQELSVLGHLPFGTHGWWTLKESRSCWQQFIPDLAQS